MKVWHYVLCYNEMRILPLMYNYWKTYVDKVIVIDSSSNDGSREYLKSIKDIDIEILNYDSNNQLDDINHMTIKNSIWKNARGEDDFVVVSDMDETLFSPYELRNELEYMLEHNQTIVHPNGYNIYTEFFPDYSDKLLHEYEPKVLFDGKYQCKDLIFNPNKIDEINFCPGGHWCKPVGEVNYYDRNKIIELHLHNLGLYYKLEHYHKGKRRLSERNIKHEYGIQYLYDDEKIINEFKNDYNKCIDINEILKTL